LGDFLTERVQLCTAEGIVQILPYHADYIGEIFPGEIIITEESGTTQHFQAQAGVLYVSGNEIKILMER
jgi:F0F1-type ATP synthase epsilon subunit